MPSLLKKSSGEELFKETAGIARFESDVWDQIEGVMLQYFLAVAKQAGEKANAQERTVLESSDISPVGSGGSSSGNLATPQALFAALQALPTEDVIKFTRLLDAWFKAEKDTASKAP